MPVIYIFGHISLTNYFQELLSVVFFGYNMLHRGYHCFDHQTNWVYTFIHVCFNKEHFSFTSSSRSSAPPSSWAFVPVLSPLLQFPSSSPQERSVYFLARLLP